ncbi:MAG: error-prone polymerase, partial [Nocardioidaceae bacterium]|nr:error-prone polymerase [Nocardioidaceae bacterium]
MDPFVHLHVASGYSLKYGASHPHALVQRAAEAEMDTLALTDRDGVYGVVRFAKACMRSGIRPVLGVDLAVERSGLLAPPPAPARPGASRTSPARGGTYRDSAGGGALPRVTLLAGSKVGWAALCRLVSATHLRGQRGDPVSTPELIGEHCAGLGSDHDLVVLLGPASELGQAAALRRDDLAREVIRRWRDVTGPASLVVEVVSQRVAGHGPGSSQHAARMAGVAASAGTEVVLTNAVRYADRSDAPTVDILDSVRRLVPLDLRHLDRA